MRQTIPLAVKAATFCYCTFGGNTPRGSTLDLDSGRWVHSVCRKPAPGLGIRICSVCDDEFIDFDQIPFRISNSGRRFDLMVYCKKCM